MSIRMDLLGLSRPKKEDVVVTECHHNAKEDHECDAAKQEIVIEPVTLEEDLPVIVEDVPVAEPEEKLEPVVESKARRGRTAKK